MKLFHSSLGKRLRYLNDLGLQYIPIYLCESIHPYWNGQEPCLNRLDEESVPDSLLGLRSYAVQRPRHSFDIGCARSPTLTQQFHWRADAACSPLVEFILWMQ